MSKSYVKAITAICIGFVFLSAGTQGDTDEDQFSDEKDIPNPKFIRPNEQHNILPNESENDIFQFSIPDNNMNIFTTPSHLSSEQSTKSQDAETLYRFAIGEAMQLLDAQETQINFTKIYFSNVWGAEDEGVRKITAKLNSMKTLLSQKIYKLKNILASSVISHLERSTMPIDWVIIDMLGRGWKEVESFIDDKCTQRNLTKSEEDQLFALREWLKYSDQELAIPYDSMKGHMEKVLGAETRPSYTIPPTSTSIHPFSLHD